MIKKELESLKTSDTSKELLLIHYEEAGNLYKFTLDINGEHVECYKVLKDSYSMKEKIEATPKEKATIMLQLNIDNLAAKLDTLQKRISGFHNEAVKMRNAKRKDVAVYLLRQKKLFQKHWDRFTILKYQLEEQLLTIDNLEANNNLMKAFKLVENAHKSLKVDIKDAEELFDNLKEHKEEHDGINELIRQSANEMCDITVKLV